MVLFNTPAILNTHRADHSLYCLEKQKATRRNVYLFKMMNGKPYFTLGVEYATQVAPGDGKTWLCLNGLQIACLCSDDQSEKTTRGDHQSDSSVKYPINNARNTRKQWNRTLIIFGLARHACDRASQNTVTVYRQPGWWRPVFPMLKVVSQGCI